MKKEEEKIRKSVQSDKLEEFFEPVTKAIKTTPPVIQAPAVLPAAVGQLVPAVPVPNIMDLPVPAIEEPEAGPPVVELLPGGVNIFQYDAEEKLDSADLSNEEKFNKAKGMNVKLGQMKSDAQFPQDIIYLQDKNRKYYQGLKGKKVVAVPAAV